MVAAVTTRANGKAEMAYVGATPWHGLGQALEAGANIETWKEAAGMDWKIGRSRVRYGEGPNQQIYDDAHVLFRSDTKAALGIVSPKYKTVQPGEVLEFFRDLTESQGYVLNTAGTLFDGKRFWALAKVGDDAVVVGDDRVGGYLLLSTSCDGTLATTAKFTTVRVVCNNTLSMALSKSSSGSYTLKHTSKFCANEAKNSLGLATGQFAEFMAAARLLSKKQVSRMAAGEFVESLLADTKTVLGEDVRKSKQFTKIMDLFNGSAMGGTLLGTEGTMWGLVNATTEFVDYSARSQTVDARLSSAWFGRGDALKTTALERALALV
jgi:phage/plasmid-like protein (TIGR03299 family)